METQTNPFNDYVFLNATPSDRGSFTLATDKALAKLEKFQLPDPTFFILQWVQALAASQAQRVDMSYSTTSLKGSFELILAFDGPGYSRAEVDGLYDHVFRSGRDRSMDRLRELALGWLSAGALRLTHLSLASNGFRRLKEPGRPEVMESHGTPEGIHRLVVRGKGHHDFEDIVTRRCAECVTRLTFNGNQVSGTDRAGGVPWPNRPFQVGPSSGVMGATYGGDSSHISFLRYGVEFVARPERSLQPPVIVRTSDPTLSKNVSQTDVVRDEAYEEFLERLRSEMKKMGLQLTNKRIPSYQRDSLNKFIQAYLVSHIDIRVFSGPERLKLLGEDLGKLIDFPLFRVAGGRYVSLSALQQEYHSKGYLLYSLDEKALMARWSGVLLVVELEEVLVLRKYFANLTSLTWSEVRNLCQGGMNHKLSDARRRPIVCSQDLSFRRGSTGSPLQVQVPDLYPNGRAVMVKTGELHGKSVPAVPVSLLIQSEHGPIENTSELARLRHELRKPVSQLLVQLCELLSAENIGLNQSRARYAELACEQLLYLQYSDPEGSELRELLQGLGPVVGNAPLIGLENGELVSAADLLVYADLTGEVFVEGAFIEGLECGALDPMPKAKQLIQKLLHPSQAVYTRTLRNRIEKDPDIKFRLRRQTIMKGLAQTPSPEIALRNFANEAAAQAEEMARMEQEYRRALEGDKLFIKPDDARLAELTEVMSEDDFEGFDLTAQNEAPSPPEIMPSSGSQAPTQPLTPPPLPPLEQDLQMLRQTLGDFCSQPGAVHVERRETRFTLHLSTRWTEGGSGDIQVLQDGRSTRSCPHPLPVEGFIRLSPTEQLEPDEMIADAVEQLVLKVLQTQKEDAAASHQRKRIQAWLLECCSLMPFWRQNSYQVATELASQALVPCLGSRMLSWKQLLRQARRLGHTPVFDSTAREATPDPLCDVIGFDAPWRDKVMEELAFPRAAVWRGVKRDLDFDTLLQGSVRELLNVLSLHEEDLVRPEIVGKLSGESSFWTRWRSGFLSWDESLGNALVNPEHKLARKLLSKYQPDVSWSGILASALFSTINRGLEEVDDDHERQFLQGLLDSLD